MLSCEWRSGPSLPRGQLCFCRITVPDNSTMKDGFGSSSNADTESSGGPELTPGAKAGIALGVIGGILFGVLAVLGISHWQRRNQSKTRDNKSDSVGRTEEGGASAVQVRENPPGMCKSKRFATLRRSDGSSSYYWRCVSLCGAPRQCSKAANGIQEGSKPEWGYVPSP